MKVLVKVSGKSPHTAAVHAYDEERDCVVCNRFWPRPGDDWEIQERDVEIFSQIEYACWNCVKRLKPKPPRAPSMLERRRVKDLDELARWRGG